MKRSILITGKILFGALLLLGGFTLFLEVGSRQYERTRVPQDCPQNMVCDLGRYPVSQEKIDVLASLVDKQRRGERTTRDDLDRAMVLVPAEDMVGLNGITCNGLIYVSDRLPLGARYYVARHELEHIFQLQGAAGDCQGNEFCATWIAAGEYPFGLLRTIFSSLVGAYRLSPSVWAFLFNAWIVFKYYFLSPG